MNYFLGNDAYLENYNKQVIVKLKGTLGGGLRQRIPISDTIIESLRLTYFWAYNVIDDTLKVTSENENIYNIDGEIKGRRRIQISDNIIWGSSVDYTWLSPFKEGSRYFQYLLISNTRIDEQSIVFEVDDERTLIVKYVSVKVGKNNETFTMSGQKEIIFSEWNMMAGEDNVKEWLNSKEKIESNELRFKIELSFNRELKDYVGS